MLVRECERYLFRATGRLVSSERGGEFLDSDGGVLAVQIPERLLAFTSAECTEETIQIGGCRMHCSRLLVVIGDSQ
ncbi:hypothetical protein DMJ13_21290 [halophilic archaeon]|nr:hypothetical protein DMJ13_21290 [halophilic archaeon]